MKAAVRILLLVALSVVVAACISQRPEPPRSVFSLAPEYPSRPASSTGPVLAVRLLETAPEFETQFFVYRTGDFTWESDFFRVFADSPSAQITAVTRRWLQGSGMFSSIAIPGLAPGNSWQLQGFVDRLYGDFRDRSHPQAVLSMSFSLLPPGSTAKSDVVFTKNFHANVPLAQNSPDGLMRAWDAALSQVLRELVSELRRVDWTPPEQ